MGSIVIPTRQQHAAFDCAYAYSLDRKTTVPATPNAHCTGGYGQPGN